MRRLLEDDGFYLVPAVFNPLEIARIQSVLASWVAAHSDHGEHGVRHVMTLIPEIADLARSKPLLDLAKSVLGPKAQPVKSTFFDKVPEKNWKVPRHQDLTIAVRQRREAPGFNCWTTKADVPHVQPPSSMMAKILAFRVHLDPCDAASGALKVVPGSHVHGRLDRSQINALAQAGETVCTAQPGDVLIMSPLIIHASSPAQKPSHRRVIHLEYTALDLPNGLAW